jgi:hypothetical protein
MRSLPPLLLVLLLSAAPAVACSFCGGNVGAKATLREEFARAKAVVAGKLKNPKVNADGISGTTEFHFDTTLKSAAVVKGTTMIVLPKYFPVVGATPPDYLMFFDDRDGKPDAAFGVASTKELVAYLAGLEKVDATDPAKRLAYHFRHLDSPDPAVSGDAFLEFAKASDADVIRAKAALDPKRLQKWLTDPTTPADRVGVYAMLLGLCGEKGYAATFAALLAERPMADRVRDNLGGVLAGYALLDPATGWACFTAILTDQRWKFEDRYAALTGVRYLQANRSADSRAEVLKVYRTLLADTDFADLVIDDLRKWGWWELSADVLKRFDGPMTSAAVKKAVVRYALTDPGDAAKRFVTEVRKADPKLVEKVEDGLKLLK